MSAPAFDYVRPSTLQEALHELAAGGAWVHAGGTDLLGCWRDGILAPDKVVSLARLEGLRGIVETADGGLRLGAMTTIAELASHPLVRQRYQGLAQAAAAVSTPQLRSQGTLGGNLCQKPRCWYYRGDFPCLRKGGDLCYAFEGENQLHCIFGGDGCYAVHPSDTAPALVALDARVRAVGPRGVRWIPVEELHVLPAVDPTRETTLEAAEVLTEVILPPPAAGLRSSYRKVRARRSWDFALAGVALALAFDGDRVRQARVVLSGAAPVPWRSQPVEAAITGRPLDAGVVARAREVVVEGASPLSGNAYKLPLFAGLIGEELERMASRGE